MTQTTAAKHVFICRICGEPFRTNRKQQIYCTPECAHKSYNARKREKMRAKRSKAPK